MKICPNCSTPLSDDAKFCSSCGCTINNTQTNAYDAGAGYAEPYAEPVINDFAYSQQQYAPDPYAQPTMDSVQPVIDPAAQSVPTMDSVQPAMQFDSNGFAYNQGYGQYQQPYDNNNYAQQYGGYEQPQQYSGYEQPQQNFNQPPMQYEQPKGFQNPEYINPASPQMPGVTPGKTGGSSLIVPIILIILILAVIFIDVFWLFRDQIWGKKDDSSTAAVSYITLDE